MGAFYRFISRANKVLPSRILSSSLIRWVALFFKLNRPFHATWLTVPSVLAGALLSKGAIDGPSLCLFSAFAWLATCIGNFINDYYDVESDKICRAKAPLAAGIIGRELAWKILIAEYVISVFILAVSALIARSPLLFMLGAIPLTCTYIYSAPPFKAKNRAALGPITISVAYMAVILGGWTLASELSIEAVKCATFFGLLMLGVGFSKDFMHIKADRGFCNTPPIAYGIRRTAAIASFCLIFPIVSAPYFVRISHDVLSLLMVPLVFALIAVFFMITNPTAENRNIVMSAFLVYMNASYILVFNVLMDVMLTLILLAIVDGAIITKTFLGL
jgi:4-hydroxybenzoate polyprenyltransferase